MRVGLWGWRSAQWVASPIRAFAGVRFCAATLDLPFARVRMRSQTSLCVAPHLAPKGAHVIKRSSPRGVLAQQ
jgi:hypothetical protein